MGANRRQRLEEKRIRTIYPCFVWKIKPICGKIRLLLPPATIELREQESPTYVDPTDHAA
ncbi:hypothetical protein GCM10011403_16440 [Pseudohongiella nitratireducens]|uniref:Uncharacterized protein n=1 Tax=Pseudohongiella nitratireducens TaxID=1768907 RepID=A0A917LV16_9GAMM|nr:hypothetical protein GCM10011403_16440 [Pseudohongiella nitratireducens]|tara:strand:+ start:10576 stop:10755 length:180 start_codon:yes stop_codon:yes gene_type:complete